MSPRTESLMKKLVVLATVVGLGSALAFSLVACGSTDTSAAAPAAPAWRSLPTGPLKGGRLAGLASAWTGKELIVVGVRPGPDGTFIKSTNVAAAYDPATRTWRRLPGAPKMDNYCRSSVAWTGKELVLWGCGQAAFDPKANSWRMLPKAPTGQGFTAWTDRELIGWGGGCCGDANDGGSAYDPVANRWRTLAQTPLPPEQGALGAWTGHRLLLVVSGYSPDDKRHPARFARAAAYDPAADTWYRLASPPANALRYGGTAAWNGHELLAAANHVLLAYDPASNRWRSLARPPRALVPMEAFWTGRRLVVLGGGESRRAFSYDPRADRWAALPPVPVDGPDQTAAWAGHELIVWSPTGGVAFAG